MWTHTFFRVPTLEFGHRADVRSEYKVETLYSGTKVGTVCFLCAHNFCKIRAAVHCFVLAAKLKFQNGVWQGEMEKRCKRSHIGYSKCDNNNILCRYPVICSQAPSVNSPFLFSIPLFSIGFFKTWTHVNYLRIYWFDWTILNTEWSGQPVLINAFMKKRGKGR